MGRRKSSNLNTPRGVFNRPRGWLRGVLDRRARHGNRTLDCGGDRRRRFSSSPPYAASSLGNASHDRPTHRTRRRRHPHLNRTPPPINAESAARPPGPRRVSDAGTAPSACCCAPEPTIRRRRRVRRRVPTQRHQSASRSALPTLPAQTGQIWPLSDIRGRHDVTMPMLMALWIGRPGGGRVGPRAGGASPRSLSQWAWVVGGARSFS